MPYIDLTIPFTSSMPVFPGDPASSLTQSAFLDKNGYNDHKLLTAMHVGTHIDAPLHMIANGKKISDFKPEKFIGKGVLIDARDKTIDEKLLNGVRLDSESIVLVYTGHSRKFQALDYHESYPEITEGFAKALIAHKVKIVGMDTPSPDKSPFTVHKLLLSSEILIIENLMNLDKLLKIEQFDVIALPMNLETDAAPIRVVAKFA